MNSNPEREIAETLLAGTGETVSKLGLRFDRVVVSVLGDLRAFVEDAAPPGVSLVVTLTAPIRLPAKTVSALKPLLTDLLAAEGPNRRLDATVNGNGVGLRVIQPSTRPVRLVGLVHNPTTSPAQLLDLAEGWLRRPL